MSLPLPHRFDVSIVICAYTERRWDSLRALVQSLRAQTVLPREIILVVDHNDLLLGRARRSFPDLIVVPNTVAPGASGARNSGVALAHGAIIAFIDDDAIAAPDWLERLAACYTNDTVLGVGGSIMPLWAGGQPRWFPLEFGWVVGCSYRGLPPQTAAVRNLIAANMSVRRDVFVELGGFRPGFGNVKGHRRPRLLRLAPSSGDEETEFCLRAAQRWPGRAWLYEPDACVGHHVPPERMQPRYFLFRCYDEGLGKAALAHVWGRHDSLSAEGHYTMHTLPRGIKRGLQAALLRREPAGLARACAIAAGLGATMLGFAVGYAAGGRPLISLRAALLALIGGTGR